MKKGYWVVAHRSISDESALRPMRALARPAVESFGGRDVIRLHESPDSDPRAGLQQRTILVEFDSYEIGLAAYESEAYRKALQALGSGAERDFRIIEGRVRFRPHPHTFCEYTRMFGKPSRHDISALRFSERSERHSAW